MKKKDRSELIDAALTKYFEAEFLKPYQAELIKLQQHLERTGPKVIILFDGRDASGKGGTIRRVTRYMNEKALPCRRPGQTHRNPAHRAPHEALHRAVPARRRNGALRPQLVQPRHGRADHGLLHQIPV